MSAPTAYADPLKAGFCGTWVHPYCFATSACTTGLHAEVAVAKSILDWMVANSVLINPPYLLHTPPKKYEWATGLCMYFPNFSITDEADKSQPWQDNRFTMRNTLHRRHAMESVYAPAEGRWAVPAINVLFGPLNWQVQWYLMLSYAYYKLDVTFVPDSFYDQLCAAIRYRIAYDGNKAPHQHIHLVDDDVLAGGSAYHIKDYPTMIMSATQDLVDNKCILEM